jgi:uncharacterized protein DUF6636
MCMWRIAPCLAALVLVAGCGSDEKKSTTGAKAPTSSTGTLPPVQGKASKKKNGGAKPQAVRSGERIQTGTSFFFETPSGKVGCGVFLDPTSLRCDTMYETSFSRSGHTCTEGDYGHAFQVFPTGNGKAICAGDTVASATDSHTIPYGKTWLLGPFSCTARQSGLTCSNGQGHGFALSVESQRLF